MSLRCVNLPPPTHLELGRHGTIVTDTERRTIWPVTGTVFGDDATGRAVSLYLAHTLAGIVDGLAVDGRVVFSPGTTAAGDTTHSLLSVGFRLGRWMLRSLPRTDRPTLGAAPLGLVNPTTPDTGGGFDLERITIGSLTLTTTWGQTVLRGPLVADATNPARRFPRELHMDFDTDPPNERTALEIAVAMCVIDAVHEVCEWAAVDGETVFVAHPGGRTEDQMWWALAEMGAEVGEWLLDRFAPAA